MTNRAVLAAVLSTFVISTAACSPTDETALNRAVEQARGAAAKARDQLWGLARSGKGEQDGVAALGADHVFGSRVTEHGFEIDAVFYGKGDAGGGGTYEGRSVRLCVRLTTYLSPDSKVEISDTDCPSSLPKSVPYYGEIEQTIRLNQ